MRQCHYVCSAISAASLLLLSGADAYAEHPSLYFDAAGLDTLKGRAADAVVNALGYAPADAFAPIKKAADDARATAYSVTIDVPNSNGVGTKPFTYTLNSTHPSAPSNNPSYPTWTKISRELQGRMQNLAFAYAITGDGSYLTNADKTGGLDMARQIAAWSVWSDPGYSCGSAGKASALTCLDTAHLTLGMSLLYDLAFSAMSDADRTTIRNALVGKGIKPLATDTANTNAVAGGDLAWFNGYALRVAGLAVGASAVAADVGDTAKPWLTLAAASTQGFFDHQGKDGGAFEGHLYGSYAVDNLVLGVDALARQGAADLWSHPWLVDLVRFAAAFLSDSATSVANFGDSSEAAYWVNTSAALASRGDAKAQWYLQEVHALLPGGINRFVWARPDVAPVAPEGSGSALFADIGHASLRQGWSGAPVVAVKSGPPTVTIGHNHFDANSFIFSAYGQWIAADPGYEDYFNTARHTFTTGSIGHNTIVVDKAIAAGGTFTTGQTEKVGGQLEYLFDGAGYAKIVGHAAATYPSGLLTKFDRRVFFAKPDVALVFDDIAAPKAHAYSFLMHSGAVGKMEKGTSGPNEVVSRRGGAQMQTFVVSTATLGAPGIATYPGAENYGPYAEWKTAAATTARFAAVLVPGHFAHIAFDNPGFESGIAGWQPRFTDGSHEPDSAVAHGGVASARITFATVQSGYYYSEPMSLGPESAIKASVWFKAGGATGAVSIQTEWMKGGSYTAMPGGKQESVDVAGDQDWAELTVTDVAPDGADGVRIALRFDGTGTVWFDDATYSADDVEPSTELSKAVALGSPAAGIAVKGPFGIEAAASLVGGAAHDLVTLAAASDTIPEVPSLASDGDMFAVGLDPKGKLRRAYLQSGTVVKLGDTVMVTASTKASFDVGVTTISASCRVLSATEVPTVEGGPYSARATPSTVFLNGDQVKFLQEGDVVTFPSDAPAATLGEPCASLDPSGSVGPGASSSGAGNPGSPDGGGCGCRAAGGSTFGPSIAIALMLGCAGLVRRVARRVTPFGHFCDLEMDLPGDSMARIFKSF